MNVNVTVQFGGGNRVTRSYPVGTRLSAIVGDPHVKATLGYGDNIQVLIDRRHVGLDYTVGTDLIVSIETKANQKAAGTVHVTIRFGGANTVERDFPVGTRVGTIINDPNVRGALGIGGNVRAMIDRIEQDEETPVDDGDVIVLETVANQKAA